MNIKTCALFVYLAFMSGQYANGQCVMVPVDLQVLADESESILEGRLRRVKTFMNTDNNIYSVYALEVASVYKGPLLDTVYIVSLGGRMGLQITKAEPSDDLSERYGIFFLSKSTVAANGLPLALQFGLTASAQGKLWLKDGKLEDVFNRYDKYEAFKASLVGITHAYTKIHSVRPDEQKYSPKRATPSITSFTPTTRTAGTDSVITITGTNFNSPRGSGFVAFRDADDGGSSFIVPEDRDYISWTNTQIVVKVPTGAGTGTIAVQNSDPANTLSSASLVVPYNLINVVFDTAHHSTRLQGLNSGAKMMFTFNTRFNDSARAKRDFVSSMQNWRCKTLVNWDTATSTSSATAPSNNGVHLVLWDFSSALATGVLGVAISNFSGCISAGDTFFYVNDLDVIFNDVPFTGYTWEYGPGIPSSIQFDFESVATHELGHGHQLGHVVDASKVMHFSIANGQRKNVISTQDSFGGKNIMAKNVVSVCGQTAMTPLNSTNCAYFALPVEWIDLAGINQSGHIALNWKVFHEYEVEKYRIERSYDGKDFEEIGILGSQTERGSNNYLGVLSYDFIDRDFNAVKNGAFYRISSLDYDGKEQVGSILYVKADHIAYFYIKNEGSSIVLSSSLQFEAGGVIIYNSIGQQMPFTHNGNNITLTGISKGVYYIIQQSGDQFHTQKIVVDL
jgi:hypothetical protein